MKKILLVDDEPHVVRILKLFLDKYGYEITVANNGEQALSRVNENIPDVVITDVQMPIMTGQELCRRLKGTLGNECPHIIIMTSRTDRDLRDWADKDSDIEFLEKPLSPRKLVNSLAEHFQKNLTECAYSE